MCENYVCSKERFDSFECCFFRQTPPPTNISTQHASQWSELSASVADIPLVILSEPNEGPKLNFVSWAGHVGYGEDFLRGFQQPIQGDDMAQVLHSLLKE